MKYFYKDFVTGKLHWTRATFFGWTGEAGPLGVRYAIFQRKSGTLFVPEYLLTCETREVLLKEKDIHTFAEGDVMVHRYTHKELKEMETLLVGQDADLKVEKNNVRVWLVRKMEEGEMYDVTVTRWDSTSGRWKTIDEYLAK